jgi:hypothetical protein
MMASIVLKNKGFYGHHGVTARIVYNVAIMVGVFLLKVTLKGQSLHPNAG